MDEGDYDVFVPLSMLLQEGGQYFAKDGVHVDLTSPAAQPRAFVHRQPRDVAPGEFHRALARFTMPTTMLNVVVLPAPFGPSSPTISPAPTATDTPSTTRRWPRYTLASFSVASNTPFVCDVVGFHSGCSL